MKCFDSSAHEESLTADPPPPSPFVLIQGDGATARQFPLMKAETYLAMQMFLGSVKKSAFGPSRTGSKATA
jgi:hypothetical protein